MKKCTYCGKAYPDNVLNCPVDGEPVKEAPPSDSAPVSPPPLPPQKTAEGRYVRYEDVPWYRREPGTLAFIGVLFCGFISIALCFICLTGDVYKKPRHPERGGDLQVWGVGNKIAAVIILALQGLVYLVYFQARASSVLR